MVATLTWEEDEVRSVLGRRTENNDLENKGEYLSLLFKITQNCSMQILVTRPVTYGT